MSQPLLTIITVTKDDAPGLRLTLASAAALRESGVEHLVIDGGEDERAAETPPGVTLIRRPPKGISDAFNAGLAAAQGEWVWFLNGGDRIDARLKPDFLLGLLAECRASVLVGGITYEGEPDLHPHFPPVRQWPPVQPWIPHPATLVRRALFERFGLFDERYTITMDYEWWLRSLCGNDVTVNMVSAPFTVFALGGISQRADCGDRLRAEMGEAFRQHQWTIWRLWWVGGARLLKTTLRAWFARRLG